jgi:hypothetical protein
MTPVYRPSCCPRAEESLEEVGWYLTRPPNGSDGVTKGWSDGVTMKRLDTRNAFYHGASQNFFKTKAN